MYISLNHINFKKELFKKERSIIVEFGADWCGGCHIYEPMLEELIKKSKGKIEVGKVDIDLDKKLKDQYGIQEIPTLLFYKNGQIVDSIIGVVPKEILETKIDEMVNFRASL